MKSFRQCKKINILLIFRKCKERTDNVVILISQSKLKKIFSFNYYVSNLIKGSLILRTAENLPSRMKLNARILQRLKPFYITQFKTLVSGKVK